MVRPQPQWLHWLLLGSLVSVACADDTSSVGGSDTDTGTSSGDAPSTVSLTTTTLTGADTTEGPADTTEGPADTTEGSTGTTEGPADTTEGPTGTTEGSTEGSTDTTDGTTDSTDGSTDTGSTTSGGGVCGDGIVEDGEVCDGADLDGEDCASQGFDAGILACAADCAGYDVSGCVDVPVCIEEDIGNATGLAVTTGSTLGADEDFLLECVPDNAPDHVVFWFAPSAGTWQFDLQGSTYDTALAAYADCDFSSVLACNDDFFELQSRVALALQAGDPVVLAISGFGGEAGDWVLNIEQAAPPQGSCCAPTGTPGCSDPECNASICAAEPFCCDVAWDQVCSNFANVFCDICNTPDVCGNGTLDGAETCDGLDFGGETCTTLGFDAGAMSCLPDCSELDTSGCFDFGGPCCVPHATPGCGDDECVADVCGVDPFCCEVGWDGFCASQAQMLCSVCNTPGVCGNNVVDAAGELCDGFDVGAETCATQGFDAGTLSCSGDCAAFDTAGCFDLGGDCCEPHPGPGCDDPSCNAQVCGQDPFCCDVSWDGLCAQAANDSCPICSGVPVTCGNGAIDDLAEVCDGLDLGGESCATQGFDAGALGCNATCSDFDTSACVEYGGPCCSPHLTPGCFEPTCTAAICAIEPFCCDVVWDNLCADQAQATCTACQPGACGNDVIELGEACDGTDLAGESCTGLGYTGGDLACAGDCNGLDTSACIGGVGYGNCLAAPPEVACTAAEVCATDGTPPVASVCWQEDCISAAECAVPTSGNATVTCGDVDSNGGTECFLACNLGQTCPDGMVCYLGSLCAWLAP